MTMTSETNPDTQPPSILADALITLDVGGYHYTIKRNTLIQRDTDSFFARMLNSNWKESTDVVIPIQRNGELFKYVYVYLIFDKLPCNKQGATLLTSSEIKELKVEAEFYQLPGLVDECTALMSVNDVEQQVMLYAAVHKQIEDAIGWQGRCDSGEVVFYETKDPENLLALLRSKTIFAPAWVIGELTMGKKKCNPTIFKSTTLQSVNVEELLAHAKQSSFGRGSETVLDTNVRNSMEIVASELGDLTDIIRNMDISSLAPNMKLSIKPYKLVIYRQGGHFDNHRDTVRDEKHIGTVVLILNTDYTGGELEISHCDESVRVTGALKWVAMYGDCIHTIHPVMSGSRVSLIFDIWNNVDDDDDDEKGPAKKRGKLDDKNEKDEDDEYSNVDDDDEDDDDNDDDDDDDDDDSDNGFWPNGRGMDVYYWLEKGQQPQQMAEKTTETRSIPMVANIVGDTWSRIYEALDGKLKKYASVCICTEHLYPACQANMEFLKGGDRVLYEMLSEKFHVGVTPIVIGRSYSENDGDKVRFKEFAVKDSFSSSANSSRLLDMESKNVLVVPKALCRNSVLHYTPGIEYTGNASQEEEFVYLAAALVVRTLDDANNDANKSANEGTNESANEESDESD